MTEYEVVLEGAGRRVLMLGNVAYARGFLEAGVDFAAGYPGTPSTEVIEALAYASKALGSPYVEWSVNEKIALEAALGAALAGAKAVAVMKHVGLNVAADPLFSSAYTGVRGGLVVLTADDPWMWSSQNEQDNRWYGLHAYIPVIEPLTPSQTKEAARLALELSSKYKTPFILRSVTRLSHSRALITTGKLQVKARTYKFKRDPESMTLIPSNARKLKIRLVSRWEQLREELGDVKLNDLDKEASRLCILGVGRGYSYALDALKMLKDIEATVYGLATSVPLPVKLSKLLTDCKQVIVVEEGDPVVETQLKALAFDKGLDVNVEGYKLRKPYGELDVNTVAEMILKAIGKATSTLSSSITVDTTTLPPRPPMFCPGCPHRFFFTALKRVLRRLKLDVIVSGDIGCYSLGVLPPFNLQDTIIDMGASIGAGEGFTHTTRHVVIAVIGDSTFFHSGVTALINAVYNASPMLIVVLDNSTTAMTGHQPHPGTGITASGKTTRKISIKSLAEAIGVDEIEEATAYDLLDLEEKLARLIQDVAHKGIIGLLVVKGYCMLKMVSEARKRGISIPSYRIEEDKCSKCLYCYHEIACPAIIVDDSKPSIDPLLCTGCGLCHTICPSKAIIPETDVTLWRKILEGGMK